MQRLGSIAAGVFMAWMLVLTLGGCQKSPEQEVLAQYHRGEEAIGTHNSTEYRNIITPESVTQLDDAIRLALEATEEQARALEPFELQNVIMFRNRISPEQLRRMTADDALAWMMDKGILIVDKEYGLEPESVRITGDTAIIQMGTRVARSSTVGFGRRGGRAAGALLSEALGGGKIEPVPGIAWNYKKINGYWYSDNVANDRVFNEDLINLAKEEGVPVDEYILKQEREQAGRLKQDIWTPPGRG